MSNNQSGCWKLRESVRQGMVFLQGHGVSSTYAIKIFKAYGNKAIAIVSKNSYRLALDISGFGHIPPSMEPTCTALPTNHVGRVSQ